MGSSMGPATEALYDLLAARLYPPGPQVAFGPPDDFEDQEVVCVLGIEEPDEESAVLGNQRREERYNIDVRIKVHDPAADAGREVFLRALALREEVRSVVAANPTLKDTVRFAQVIGGGLANAAGGASNTAIALHAEGGGFVSFAAARVACQARIT